jgi:hypothetical protein
MAFEPTESARPAVTRLSGNRDVLAVIQPTGAEATAAAGFAAGCARLRRLYEPVLPGATHATRWIEQLGVGVVTIGAGGSIADHVLWGTAVGADGVVSDGDVLRLASTPAQSLDLLGRFVGLAVGADDIRLVTSASPPHTLKRVVGPAGVAWATKGVAALALAGVRPRVAAERIAERVLYEYTLSDDELFEGVRVLPPASLVVISRDRVDQRELQPIGEALAPGRPSTPVVLRDAVGAAIGRLAAVPAATLGLTAGRDSTLLTSCLAEQGGRLPTFTFGLPQWPDVAGAAAVAEAVGWPHHAVGPSTDPAPATFEHAVAMSAWAEGLDTGRDIASPDVPAWPGEPITWITGSGGEAGRAFYW